MGIERPRKSPGKIGVLDESGAVSGTLDAHAAHFEPDLAAVIETWPTLPSAIRSAIGAMMDTAK
jgi:hypothetical protein